MRRKLNLKLLAWGLAGLVLAGGALHFLHERQVTANASALLRQAQRAEADGQLRQAATYLSHYLACEPGDTDALVRYALTLDRLADNPGDHYQAWLLLEQAVRREPGRKDLREHAARLALALYRYEEAAGHLEALLQQTPGQAEVEYTLGWCREASGDYASAATAYGQSLRHDPKRLDGYQRLADLLYARLERPEQAGKVLDDMVAANPKSYDAYLRRGRHRQRLGSLEEAWEDVGKARELAPDQVEVLLAGAELAVARGDLAAARGFVQRGLDRHRRDVRLYEMQSWLSYRAGEPAEAVAALRRGLDAVPGSVALRLALADILVEGGDLKEAAAAVERARQGASAAVADAIEARLLARQGRWIAALRLLEKVHSQLLDPSRWRGQADLLMGRCYGHLGDRAQQLAACRRAVAFDPGWPAARLDLGAALLAQGQVQEALAELRQAAASSGAPPESWVWLGRALLAWQQSLPAERRDWQELEATLARADEVQPATPEVRILRAELLTARGQLEEGEDLLTAGCREQPTEARLWVALADLALRRGDIDTTLTRLTRANRVVGQALPLWLAWARYWAYRGGPAAPTALQRLGQHAAQLPPEQRARLERELAGALTRLGDEAGAERLWAELAGRLPTDLHSRFQLLELTLNSGREDAARRTLAELHQIEGEDGVLWRYGEAAWRIARDRKGELGLLPEARKYLTEAGRRRPGWARVALLEAAAAEIEGNGEASTSAYVQALERGENEPDLVYRIARRLYERRRYEQAEQVLRRAEALGPLENRLARLGAEVALKRQDIERALALVRQAAPPESRDYRDNLWRARLLEAAGRPGEAEDALRQAVRTAGSIPDAWVALVQHLARQGQRTRADAVLDEVRRALPPEQARVALARCQEALGRLDQAEKLFKEHTEARPDDLLALRGLAEFYLRTARPAQAEPILRHLIDSATAAPAEIAIRARRQLAVALATAARPDGFPEALALLDRNGQIHGRTVEDDRARAAVLATRPDRRREALRLLVDSRDRKELAPDEQLLLVKLLEAEGDSARARDLLLDLLAAEGRNPDYLAYHVRRLLEGREVEEAQKYLSRLEGIEPASARTGELREALEKARRQGEPVAP
jgi:tetratricopeptide (TPR) repeat protein